MVAFKLIVCVAPIAMTTAAFAQSNDVFLGQIGDTNTIAIEQTGARNRVGSEGERLRLNQLGDQNAIVILQVGEDNGVGGEDLGGAAIFLTGRLGSASGLYQIGVGNRLDVEQRTAREGGRNVLGAIRQDNASASPEQANEAIVRQTGGAFDPIGNQLGTSNGPGLHRIDEITQRSSDDPSPQGPNRLAVQQSGLQQTVGQLHQDGAANTLAIRQTGEVNSLRMVRQDGATNAVDLREDGNLNTLGNVIQFGTAQAATVRIDGSGNLLEQIVQTGLGGLKGTDNTAFVSIVGDRNGGDGIGGYSAVSAQGVTLAAYAASLEQYGDRNALTLTIGSDGGRADGNGFSALQTGTDNQASVVIGGDASLVSLLQSGDGNVLDLLQTSDAKQEADEGGNRASLLQEGAMNRMETLQSGHGNRLDVRMTGDRNVAISGRPETGLTTLARGLEQNGRNLTALLEIAGNRNAVVLRQTGADHTAVGSILGDANTTVIFQSGTGHSAISRQFGARNYALIQQD